MKGYVYVMVSSSKDQMEGGRGSVSPLSYQN